jgi:hypothetical protein
MDRLMKLGEMRIDQAERRRRLAVRHGLASGRDGDPADVARRLVALHSTDPATVYLSLWARMAPDITAATIEESLYERRDLIRMLAMRRTVFVVPAESVPVVQASTADRLARDQRARLLKFLDELSDVTGGEPWLADVEQSVLKHLADRGGTASAAELSTDEPRLRTTLTMAAGKDYQASQTITSRVLLVLAAQGKIVRGRPVGSWLSQQYRWTLAEYWLPAAEEVSEPQARAELARQWLAAFGPAPLADLKWWTGWTMTQVRQAAASLGAVEVELADGSGADGAGAAGAAAPTGVALPGDLAKTPDPGPWAALLPALDPTVMGWSDRSWFLGPHKSALFDINGNAGPTIWLNGSVVGGWAQRASGEIVIRLLDDVGADAITLIESAAERLASWLGTSRVTPRFRTPLERELSA